MVDCIGQRCKEMDPHRMEKWPFDKKLQECVLCVWCTCLFLSSLGRTSSQRSKEQNHDIEVSEATFVLFNMLIVLLKVVEHRCQNLFHPMSPNRGAEGRGLRICAPWGKVGKQQVMSLVSSVDQSMEVFIFIFEMLQNLDWKTIVRICVYTVYVYSTYI